jgi:hypothetical protein
VADASAPELDPLLSALREANPDLDLQAVRAVVREFSEALEMPEILEDLERAVRRGR